MSDVLSQWEETARESLKHFSDTNAVVQMQAEHILQLIALVRAKDEALKLLFEIGINIEGPAASKDYDKAKEALALTEGLK